MRIALDTNRYSDYFRGVPEVVDRIQRAAAVVLPFIVIGELRGGFLRGTRRLENERALRRFLLGPRVSVLFADDQTTQHYAALFDQLRRQGTPLPTNDIWIAALAMQHHLTLYARDRHFDHLPQLSRV